MSDWIAHNALFVRHLGPEIETSAAGQQQQQHGDPRGPSRGSSRTCLAKLRAHMKPLAGRWRRPNRLLDVVQGTLGAVRCCRLSYDELLEPLGCGGCCKPPLHDAG